MLGFDDSRWLADWDNPGECQGIAGKWILNALYELKTYQSYFRQNQLESNKIVKIWPMEKQKKRYQIVYKNWKNKQQETHSVRY